MLELAISTRGASMWVRKTATGLPLCTSSVSSFSSFLQTVQNGIEGFPIARRLAAPAIDDQVLRIAGNFRIKIVLDHAIGGLLQPAFAM